MGVESVPESAVPRQAGLSPSGALSLVAVVAVLIVVSVPRLCSLALHENEADARSTAQLLVAALRGAPDGAAPRSRTTAGLGALLQRKGLAHGISDAEVLARGALLRRHGYLFEITSMPFALSLGCVPLSLPHPSAGDNLVRAVRAWPWKHGATGCAAFLVSENGALFVHGNQGGRWDGPASAGLAEEDAQGWTRVP